MGSPTTMPDQKLATLCPTPVLACTVLKAKLAGHRDGFSSPTVSKVVT